MRISIDENLKTVPFKSKKGVENLINDLSERKHVGYEKDEQGNIKYVHTKVSDKMSYSLNIPIYNEPLRFSSHSLVSGEAYVYHKNYLEYLELCWANHYGAVLSPDIIWYMLVCELAQIISNEQERYRSLFTTKNEGKTEIIVLSDSLDVLIAEELKKLVPDGLSNSFLLNFSTTTERSSFALQAAFADAVSYSMKCCGIPFIEVNGEIEDWENIANSWKKLAKTLQINTQYSQRVVNVISTIIDSIDFPTNDNYDSFYKDIFRLERCGSGSETEVFGWITDLFLENSPDIRKIQNFSSHIAKVKYKHLQTKRSYVMKNGLFYSHVKDCEALLEPDFGYIVYQDLTKENEV